MLASAGGDRDRKRKRADDDAGAAAGAAGGVDRPLLASLLRVADLPRVRE